MLKTSKLHFTYPGGKTIEFPDIQCRTGEHWLILGQSGSGKTTLLQLLAGLRTPDQGEIELEGTKINSLRSSDLDSFRGKHIGIVFQQSHFIKSLNVEENLILTQQLSKTGIDKKWIYDLLQHLQVDHKLKSKTYELSVGEQQRVAIARALVNRPSIIFADEPTSALDDKNSTLVIELLKQEAKNVQALLMVVTHDKRIVSHIDNQIILNHI